MAQLVASPFGDAASPARARKRSNVRRVAIRSRRSRYAGRWFNLDGVSMADNSMTGTFQLNLPKDLLTEAKRQSKPNNEQLRVEGWRTSWLSRISEILVGKD
jgi:hypothetical protein